MPSANKAVMIVEINKASFLIAVPRMGMVIHDDVVIPDYWNNIAGLMHLNNLYA